MARVARTPRTGVAAIRRLGGIPRSRAAAAAHQVTADTARLLEVRLVAEGDNGPTDPGGDRVLQERGIACLPDILCNAGGVIVSYFEWLQNKQSEYWDEERVDRTLHGKLMAAYDAVAEMSRTRTLDWRRAAYVVALSHLEAVYRERGIFP